MRAEEWDFALIGGPAHVQRVFRRHRVSCEVPVPHGIWTLDTDQRRSGLRARTLGLGGQVERDRRSLRLLVRSQYVEAEYALELIGGDARGVGYLLKDRISESRFADAVHRLAGWRIRARPRRGAIDARPAREARQRLHDACAARRLKARGWSAEGGDAESLGDHVDLAHRIFR